MELALRYWYSKRNSNPGGFLSTKPQDILRQDIHRLSNQHTTQSMSILTQDQYRRAEADFKIALGLCSPFLSSEAMKDVEHYLNNAELEIAYESLGLSLNAERVDVPMSAKKILFSMGPVLGLDKEGVLNANFWKEASAIFRS